MNKIFKVIWNHATQSWTVVSELSKAHKKQSSVKQVAKLSVLAVSLVTASGSMAAESAKPVVTAYDRGGLAIGTDHVSDQSLNGATQTAGATVTAYDGIAIGNGSHAGGEDPQNGGNGHIAIGLMAKGTGGGAAIEQSAVAIGAYASATGPASTVVGSRAEAGILTDEERAEVGSADNRNSGLGNVAIGNESISKGIRTTALGYQASAKGDGTTALGSQAGATGTSATAVGFSADATAFGAVSVGAHAQATVKNAVAIGGGGASSYADQAAQATADSAIAIGKLSRARSNNSIIMGNGAETVQGKNSANGIAIGTSASVSDQRTIALGHKANASSTSATAMGDEALASGTRAIAIGRKTEATGTNSIAIGSSDQNDSNKVIVSGSRSAAIGYNNNVVSDDVFVLGTGVTVAAGKQNAVVLGNASDGAATVKAVNSAKVGHLVYNGFKGNLGGTDTLGTPSDAANTLQGRFVSVGAEGSERQIKHVAAGEISSASTDAINGSQLYAVAEKIAEVPVVYTDAEGNKVTKVGDKWYPSSDIGDAVIINGKYYPAGTTAATANDANEIKPVENVIASMHNPENHGENTAGNPVELRNIAEGTKTLAFDKDGNPLVEIDGKFYKLNDDNTADTTTEITPATPEELKALADKNVGNFAAAVSGLADLEHSDPTSAMTVADAKKLGWVVSTNQDYSEAVSHLDEVRFNNGNGITITGKTTGEDKSTRDITIEVKSANSDTLTVDADGVKVNTGSLVNASTAKDNANRGKVTVNAGDDNKVATVKNVADAINSAKWFAKANNLETTMTDRAEKGEESAAIGAGDEITFEADKNLAVKRNEKTFTYGLAKDIEVNSVTLGEGDTAVQLSADAGALKVADKEGNATQITNVDAGANTMEFDKDGNQLVNVDGTYYVVDPETGLIKLDDSNNPVKGTPATDEELEALGAANTTLKSFVAYANAASGLANLENSIETNVLTVADAKNLGWVVSASGNNYAASVTNAREVRFNGVNGVKVTGETNEETGVRNINIGLEAGNVKAEDGNTGKVTGDTNYVTGDQVANAINNSGWKTQATKVVGADGNEVANADQSTAVNPGDTVNYVDGKGTKANVVVTKVEGKPDVVNVSYDVKSADTDTLTVDANGVKVNTGSLVNASTAEGDANRGKVTVNAGDENKVATVKNVADAINSAAWTVKVADSQEAIETSTANDKGASVSAGTTVTHTAGKNLKVKRDGNNVTYALANDVSVNTVTTETATVGKGDAATTISTAKANDNVTEVKFGDKAGNPVRVTNVANGVKDGDAVNVRQLNDAKANINQNTQAIGKLNDKIDQVEKRGRKGTAIAGAIGMLPQPHTSGKSMVGVATTNYRGEQAVAVGYSRLSDNGKHIIKLSGSSNVSGKKDAMVGAAYGFQW